METTDRVPPVDGLDMFDVSNSVHETHDAYQSCHCAKVVLLVKRLARRNFFEEFPLKNRGLHFFLRLAFERALLSARSRGENMQRAAASAASTASDVHLDPAQWPMIDSPSSTRTQSPRKVAPP